MQWRCSRFPQPGQSVSTIGWVFSSSLSPLLRTSKRIWKKNYDFLLTSPFTWWWYVSFFVFTLYRAVDDDWMSAPFSRTVNFRVKTASGRWWACWDLPVHLWLGYAILPSWSCEESAGDSNGEKEQPWPLTFLCECSQEGVINTSQMGKGFSHVLAWMTSLNIPDAKEKVTLYMAQAKHEGWLNLNFDQTQLAIPNGSKVEMWEHSADEHPVHDPLTYLLHQLLCITQGLYISCNCSCGHF